MILEQLFNGVAWILERTLHPFPQPSHGLASKKKPSKPRQKNLPSVQFFPESSLSALDDIFTPNREDEFFMENQHHNTQQHTSKPAPHQPKVTPPGLKPENKLERIAEENRSVSKSLNNMIEEYFAQEPV